MYVSQNSLNNKTALVGNRLFCACQFTHVLTILTSKGDLHVHKPGALANQIVFMQEREQATSPLISVCFNLERSVVMVSLDYDSSSCEKSPGAATAAIQVHLNVAGRGYFWFGITYRIALGIQTQHACTVGSNLCTVVSVQVRRSSAEVRRSAAEVHLLSTP